MLAMRAPQEREGGPRVLALTTGDRRSTVTDDGERRETPRRGARRVRGIGGRTGVSARAAVMAPARTNVGVNAYAHLRAMYRYAAGSARM